jgi:hypothetical protein
MRSGSLCGPRKTRTVGQRGRSAWPPPDFPGTFLSTIGRRVGKRSRGDAPGSRSGRSTSSSGPYTTTSHRWHEGCPTSASAKCSSSVDSEARELVDCGYGKQPSLVGGGKPTSDGPTHEAARWRDRAFAWVRSTSPSVQGHVLQPGARQQPMHSIHWSATHPSKVLIGGAEATVGGIRLQIQG